MKKETHNFIKNTLLKGTRDYTPSETNMRKKVIWALETVFERFGYTSIETPVLTPLEILAERYGEDNEWSMYSFEDNDGKRIALPYDLTVPFSRYVATHYAEFPMPFKRYQSAKVWRDDRTRRGHLREFVQCDFDIIGSDSLLCEAEIIRVICEAFSALSLHSFKIRVNSRRIMNRILKNFGTTDANLKRTLQLLNRKHSITKGAMIKDLSELGIHDAKALIQTISQENTTKKTLDKIRYFTDITEIERFLELSMKIGVRESLIHVDPSLTRGLDYYSGIVFEIDYSGIENICGGGRYDDLCGRFCNKNFSGVGASFGIDQIVEVLSPASSKTKTPASSDVLVARFCETIQEEDMQIQIFQSLLKSDIKAELYFDNHPISKQFKYAKQKNIHFVVMCGKHDIAEEKIKIKKMDSGKQKILFKNQLIPYIKGFTTT